VIDDDTLRATVTRLARAHPSGGRVIERAAIMAEGSASSAVLRWVTDHGGVPEEQLTTVAPGRGLHSSRLYERAEAAPRRYVLPADF
jgi:hypothetical protein